jgi:two-component system sensor histidine kinase/response regulator
VDPAPGKGAAEVAIIQKIGEELSIALEGISAMAIRAQQMEVDPAMVEYFRQIRTSTETAMAAIGDLVDFSRAEGPAVVLDKARFSLRAALAALIARVGPDAEEHGCRLRMKVEQDVADTLEGDVGRLQLALKNLLDNAFILLPGAEITLQITPEYMTESGIQLSFAVCHATGTARGPADTGMGVALARFMVAAMGGKLEVNARAGEEMLYGFTVEFPVHPSPPAPRRASYASMVGMPVLVVSAEPEQRLALTNLLRGWRMVPMEADNAAMALALLERMHSEGTPVPLVILSNRLTPQDGFLLAFRIRHHAKLAGTLVMMLATQGKAGDAIACRENGIAAYMRYPVADRQLNEAIAAVTGASVDADETPTLVTRHSLREQRKGATVLLVDAARDTQILAAHILGKSDCSVVVAQDMNEAFAALDQDVYDLVLVDTTLAGLANPDAAKVLRSRITRDPGATRIVATSLDHSPAWRAARLAEGFDDTLAKPLRPDPLQALVAALGG